MRPKVLGRSFLHIGLLLSAIVLACQPSFAESGRILQLSSFQFSATAPRISAAPDGDCTVVWQQSDSTSPTLRIATRQRKAGVWKPSEIISSDIPGFQSREPIVRLDAGGQPHVIWINSSDQQNFLEYAFYTESVWVRYGLLGAVTPQKIEHPVMMLGSRNQLFATWQERVGADYQIHAFVIDALGSPHHAILSGEDQLRYVIYPDLVELDPAQPGGEPRVGLAWFSLEGSRTQLEMRVWNPVTNKWDGLSTPEWATVMLDSLPLVGCSSEDDLLLIGYKPEGKYDRIFMSSEKFPLAYLDRNTPVQNRLPRISPPMNSMFGLVWQQETDEGTNLVQGALKPSGDIYTSPLARANPLLPPQPDVALTTSSLVTVWNTLVREPVLPGSHVPLQRPAVYFSESALSSDWRLVSIPSAAVVPDGLDAPSVASTR